MAEERCTTHCGIVLVDDLDIQDDDVLADKIVHILGKEFLLNNPDPRGEIGIWIGVTTGTHRDEVLKFFAATMKLETGDIQLGLYTEDAVPAPILKDLNDRVGLVGPGVPRRMSGFWGNA